MGKSLVVLLVGITLFLQLHPHKCDCKSLADLPMPSHGQWLVQSAQVVSNLQDRTLQACILCTGFQISPQKPPTTCNFDSPGL